MEHFTIEARTPDQLDELRETLFWADDTDPEILQGIYFPGDVPNWLLFREFAGILFTNDDFCCTAGRF